MIVGGYGVFFVRRVRRVFSEEGQERGLDQKIAVFGGSYGMVMWMYCFCFRGAFVGSGFFYGTDWDAERVFAMQ